MDYDHAGLPSLSEEHTSRLLAIRAVHRLGHHDITELDPHLIDIGERWVGSAGPAGSNALKNSARIWLIFRDPATAYSWSQQLRGGYADARLIRKTSSPPVGQTTGV